MNVVFVTGATGLLGSSIVRILIDRNIKVKVLARSVEKAKKCGHTSTPSFWD